MEYDKEALQTDIDWLIGNTISKEEAKKFILSLLNATPSKELRTGGKPK